jgi:Xaa-Pro aminopeptidase
MRPTAGKLLKSANLPAFLITSTHNIRYCTGVTASVGALLALPRGFALFLDGRYTEEAQTSLLPGVRLYHQRSLQKFFSSIRRCGIEADDCSCARYIRLQNTFLNTKFVQKEGVVEHFRRSKDPRELRKIHRADRITLELLRRVPAVLKKGMTERALAWKLAQWAVELGAERLAFDPIVAFGAHTSHPHHHPTSMGLRKGHIVQIDVGAVYQGYCSDRSAVYFTAKPTPEQERVYVAVQDAKAAAERMVAPGVTTHALDAAARTVLARAGIEEAFVHALGHGVGLEVHEGVTLSRKAKNQSLLSGEVIAIEPGAYFPGKFGMRLESIVFV